jgi:pyruvate/2-oxoglutarate/acetoin dehydrogenase E1 component
MDTMREITFAQATLEAMDEEMSRDERVFVLGEDIARQGGIFGQFKGLPQKFGTDRVRDTHVIIGTFLFQGILTMTPSVINSMLQTDMSEVIRIIVSNGMILYALTRGVRVKSR